MPDQTTKSNTIGHHFFFASPRKGDDNIRLTSVRESVQTDRTVFGVACKEEQKKPRRKVLNIHAGGACVQKKILEKMIRLRDPPMS